MTEIQCTRRGGVDVICIRGDLDVMTIEQLAASISTLRQQGSRSLLWLGSGLGRVDAQGLHLLTRPFKVYRQMGGRIVLAQFPSQVIRVFQRTPWHRCLNIFDEEKDARQFLSLSPESENTSHEETEESESHD
ncbi:MAG: STAS domain-containing protein [bacterium]|nr:STAS domain-containing protein [bacterium]